MFSSCARQPVTTPPPHVYALAKLSTVTGSTPAPPLSGEGRVIVRPTWTLHDDASNPAISIAVQNASSSHSAN